VSGANRAGFRFKFDHGKGRLEVHASLGDWKQLIPETEADASQGGFVDGFFLLQKNRFGTFGHDRQLGLYVAWHLPHDDVAFDGIDDFLSRAADPGQAIDVVSTRAPQIVVSWTHHFNDRLLLTGGYGRYQLTGTWAKTPVDAIYSIGFAGVQFATGPKSALLIAGRRYAQVGLPSIPGGPLPTLRGTALIVDQRIGI
ncbi:MAG: hypothetical protein JO263_02440, partial [Candidatus Eremiobacteraeota bacterium]|nr:hypothetical protein [Candidatus Eremiobacteraeota bacterium]